MTYALNEIEATAKRATRGAGYPWGLAEEAAKATRWLCANGYDGAKVLASALTQNMASHLRDHTPLNPKGTWQANNALCPLITGAALSDFAFRLTDGPISLRDIVSPALLLPFAAMAARQLDCAVSLECDGFSAILRPHGLSQKGTCPDHTSAMSVSLCGTATATNALHVRATPDSDAWATLNALAHNTYAPATEESRRLGAGGSELTDND